MSRKIIKKIADFLEKSELDTDKYPDHEDVAEVVYDLILSEQDAEKKLVVVGQLTPEGSEQLYHVALGPYGARAVKAAQGAGEGLAWDSRSGTGNGRFMVVQMFKSAREAWVNLPEQHKRQGEELLSAMAEKTWHLSDVPVCTCGLKNASFCYRHQKENDVR